MVKEKIRNIGAILLSVVYYLEVIISISGSFVAPENQYPSDANSKSQAYFSSITTNLYYSAVGTERVAKDSNHGPVVDFKNCGSTPLGIIYSDRILFRSRFSQYTKHAISFLIRYRKADIIFPFHYFW